MQNKESKAPRIKTQDLKGNFVHNKHGPAKHGRALHYTAV